jgi:hypothetical protein
MPMKGVVWVVLVLGLSATVGCGVVYKPQVLSSGCISASRALGDTVRGARVDNQTWGPGEATIEFITQDSDEERRFQTKCSIGNDGELRTIRLEGKKIEDERFEAAKKAFSDIARSTAWANQ